MIENSLQKLPFSYLWAFKQLHRNKSITCLLCFLFQTIANFGYLGMQTSIFFYVSIFFSVCMHYLSVSIYSYSLCEFCLYIYRNKILRLTSWHVNITTARDNTSISSLTTFKKVLPMVYVFSCSVYISCLGWLYLVLFNLIFMVVVQGCKYGTLFLQLKINFFRFWRIGSKDYLYLSGNISETENLPRMVGKTKYMNIRPHLFIWSGPRNSWNLVMWFLFHVLWTLSSKDIIISS